MGTERRRPGGFAAETAKQPPPENRIIDDLAGFAEEGVDHDKGTWRLAPGRGAVYSMEWT